MTSAINTNGINVNYPVPGVNNSSQGFRDNFSVIRTDLNTAATEITDLQNNAVLKTALNGTTLNNDMANTLISNALTRGFRASTYNLGNAISGIVTVNASLGDVQYGTIAGNTTIQFTGWAPSGTQSNVELQLAISNANAVISLPSSVTTQYGVTTIENYANVANVPTITVPYGVSQMDFRFSSVDCGTTVVVEPYNRPRQSTQIQQRTPSPVGFQGDTDGTICIDPATSLAFATCTATDGTYEIITCDSTAGFYLDMPVQFSGVVFGGVTAGTVYYIRSIPSTTTFTISATPGTVSGPSALVNLTGTTGTMTVSPVSYMYVASGSYDGVAIPKYLTNTTAVTTTVTATNTRATGNLITVSSTANFVVGYPVLITGTINNAYATATYATSNVITVSTTASMVAGGRIAFTGSTFGNIGVGIYYITNIYPGNSNITVSTTFGGGNIPLTAGTGNCVASYNGIMGNLVTGASYFVQNVVSGTTFTVCANTPGGAPVALIDENGSMQVTATTDYNLTLSSTSNIANNDPIIFSGTTFGGLAANTVYYIASVEDGSNITVSQTRYNGIAGQKMALSTASGNIGVNIYEGTSIWKRTQLNSW